MKRSSPLRRSPFKPRPPKPREEGGPRAWASSFKLPASPRRNFVFRLPELGETGWSDKEQVLCAAMMPPLPRKPLRRSKLNPVGKRGWKIQAALRKPLKRRGKRAAREAGSSILFSR